MASSLEKLKEEHRLTVYWRAFELRPVGSPPLPPEYREHIRRTRPRLYAIAREHYGIEINEGPFGINSRPALIGAKYAEAHDKSDAYHMAVFRAYWQEAQPIDDQRVLAKVAEEIGLEADLFLAALNDKTLETAVLDEEELAHAHGFTGVPALVFLRRYLVMGAQPYDVLKRIVERIEAGEAG